MFGSNAFGWAYFGQGYSGTTVPTVSLTITDTITTSAVATKFGSATLTITDTITTSGIASKTGSVSLTVIFTGSSDGGQPAMGVCVAFGQHAMTAVPTWTRIDDPLAAP
jgi:hypothetical protein